MKYIEDILFILGIVVLGAGVWLVFGMGWSFIVCGAILTAIATLAAIKNNDSNQITEHDKNTE